MSLLKPLILTACGSGLLLISCINDSSHGTPGTLPTTGQSRAYTLTGDNLIIHIPADSTTYCVGDSLHVSKYAASEETLTVGLSGNTLTIGFGNADTLNRKPESLLVVEPAMVFTRTTGGSGIEGTWDLSNFEYKVTKGTPSSAEQHLIDSMNASIGGNISDYPGAAQVTFANGTMTTSSSMDYAQMFIDTWNGANAISYPPVQPDSAKYEITVVKLSTASVRLTGKTSGEVVTITWSSNGDKTFTSSNQAHAAYTYHTKPTKCPNPSQPDWYTTFLNANAKVIIGKRAASTTPAVSPDPFFRLLRRLQ